MPMRGRFVAGKEHSRECLDRGLRTRKRKQFGAAVVGRGCGLEAVVFLRAGAASVRKVRREADSRAG